jgi:transposase
MERLTSNDLLAALQEALRTPTTSEDGASGWTSRELAVRFGVSVGTIQNTLHTYAAAGRLETVRVVRVSELDGIRHRYTLYKLRG